MTPLSWLLVLLIPVLMVSVQWMLNRTTAKAIEVVRKDVNSNLTMAQDRLNEAIAKIATLEEIIRAKNDQQTIDTE